MSKGIKSSRNSGDVQEVLEWEKIGERIRELRGFHMTQKEFAKRIEVSQGHLSRIERGEKEIGAQILLSIARAFGKSIEWLLTGRDKNR